MNNKKEKDALVVDSEDFKGDWVTVSWFNYSVENHFRPMESISKLCDYGFRGRQTEIQCLSFSVTLLTMLLLLLCMYVSIELEM